MACGGQEPQNYQDCLTFSSGEWTQSHTLLSRRHVGTNSIRDGNVILHVLLTRNVTDFYKNVSAGPQQLELPSWDPADGEPLEPSDYHRAAGGLQRGLRGELHTPAQSLVTMQKLKPFLKCHPDYN